MNNINFLPVSKEDLKKRNIDILDFIIVTGDAYVDHPSFGTAIIGRVLEREGFTVGIIAQPDWRNIDDFKKLGKPKYAFLVNSGNIDSMVNHYTASKRKRHDDFYSPGGKSGYRPDRAVIVYCNKIKEAFKDSPIIIGGIEASLRRFAHYDYWDNAVRRSILEDSSADLLIYGMGEKPIVQISNLLRYGMKIDSIKNVTGTAYIEKDISNLDDYIEIPSFEEVSTNKKSYAEAYKIQYYEQDSIRGKTLVQKHKDRYVVQNPPQPPLSEEEMDEVYALPYARTYHPMYESEGGIPAIKEVKFSITSHRGCYGSCSFCALTFHQGRVIQNRSQESILKEANMITNMKDFKGYIHDVGGPTANFRHRACKVQEKNGTCKNRQCVFPSACKNLIVDHKEYLNLLRKIRKIPNVKKVFIRSGIRFDYLMYDKNDEFFKELCKHHISGQLKVAPEHINDKVLKLMGKPNKNVYDSFVKKYHDINKKMNKKQFLVPYLMSSHPGSDLKAAIELAEYIKKMGYTPEQVQDFYPTPGSLSTTMYYTEINPLTEEKVYIPKDQKEKSMQRALLQFAIPDNYDLVKEALLKAHREDLIGNGPNCLIPYNKPHKKFHKKNNSKNNNYKKNNNINKKCKKNSLFKHKK
ncbi:YgiQ family radical SAM protein [Clostridium tepidum]|uniref:YgiQ family radical SAM protein n=1 Tax=Clostridium tepidum TaxID=1962263 RepID=UPI00098EA82C|nr:YgiQ family radical SAM protein [Clostridium tepidum]MCR1935123.1 YgiQ family radical SAM protein [Clostridium tepidum]MDU6877133.1 YgiQ family radical SAM protein [Clostridium botulinum]